MEDVERLHYSTGEDVPRYFLHIDELGTDPHGTELSDLGSDEICRLSW